MAYRLPPLALTSLVLAGALTSSCEDKVVLELFPPGPDPGADNMADAEPVDTPDATDADALDASDAGQSDVDAADAADTGGADASDAGDESSLKHRYSFSDSGSSAVDSVGEAHGELQNGATAEQGSVVLDGNDDYVSLPAGLMSPLTSATLMIWASWQGNTPWQHLWDFGTFLQVDGRREADRSFFLTPMQSSDVIDGPGAYIEFRGELGGVDFGHAYLVADSQTEILPASEYHYAVVIDEAALTMSLYVDGQFLTERSLQVGASGVYFQLSDLVDTNNHLGLSQYELDPPFEGEINEFRIYSRALTPSEIETVFNEGPDGDPLY